MSTPVYFGPAAQPLFGMLHRPVGAQRHTGVLICPSWGMEYQRAYRGLRQLAQALTHKGFPVLRYDYSGTGNSGGDSRLVNLDYWIEDTQFAARELRAACGTANLCVIGLRFGALLAQEAVTQGGVIADAVALWDAPPSGDIFVRNLQHVENSLNELRSQQRRRSSQLPPPAKDELLGFDWPDALAQQVSALPGLRNDLPGRVIFVSRDRTPPDSVESIRLPDAGHWSDVERLAAPWLPAASFRIVAERLANGLP